MAQLSLTVEGLRFEIEDQVGETCHLVVVTKHSMGKPFNRLFVATGLLISLQLLSMDVWALPETSLLGHRQVTKFSSSKLSQSKPSDDNSLVLLNGKVKNSIIVDLNKRKTNIISSLEQSRVKEGKNSSRKRKSSAQVMIKY